MQAKRILLVAFGENKAGIVAQTVEGPVSEAVAASFLQEHANTTIFLDAAAAAGGAPDGLQKSINATIITFIIINIVIIKLVFIKIAFW